MPSKHNLNVSVTEHLARFVADQVASGRFGSASEVVRAGLRLLEREMAAGPIHDLPFGPATPRTAGPAGEQGKPP